MDLSTFLLKVAELTKENGGEVPEQFIETLNTRPTITTITNEITEMDLKQHAKVIAQNLMYGTDHH